MVASISGALLTALEARKLDRRQENTCRSCAGGIAPAHTIGGLGKRPLRRYGAWRRPPPRRELYPIGCVPGPSSPQVRIESGRPSKEARRGTRPSLQREGRSPTSQITPVSPAAAKRDPRGRQEARPRKSALNLPTDDHLAGLGPVSSLYGKLGQYPALCSGTMPCAGATCSGARRPTKGETPLAIPIAYARRL